MGNITAIHNIHTNLSISIASPIVGIFVDLAKLAFSQLIIPGGEDSLEFFCRATAITLDFAARFPTKCCINDQAVNIFESTQCVRQTRQYRAR